MCKESRGGVLVLFSLLAFNSCGDNAGLGSSVDTEAPKLSIEYPPLSAIIRQGFQVGGTWTDDKGVSSISITVSKNESDTTTQVYSGSATVNSDGTWQTSLNAYDPDNEKYYNGWQFSDGSYEVSAIARDAAGHTSGTSSRSFDIDNTPPVLVLTKPTTIGGNTPKTYGRSVQLEGTFSESCSSGISTLTVSFYSSDGTKIADQDFSGITDMSNANPLTIAQYYDEESEPTETDDNYIKWKIYNLLYGEDNISTYRSTQAGITEQFYFTVTATDAARTYNDFAGGTVGATGNTTTTYYRGTTDMLNLINSKKTNFPNFTVASLRNYLNKTDTSYVGNEELAEIISAAASVSTTTEETAQLASRALVNTTTSDGEVYLTFSINPKNNPTYTVSGLALNPEASSSDDNYTDGYYKYYSDSPIVVSVSPGLDGTNLDTSTVTIYYTNVDVENAEKQLFWTWNEEVALAYAMNTYNLSESSARTVLTADPATYRYTVTSSDENTDSLQKSSSLSSSSFEIIFGNNYVFSVEGADIDGQPIVESDAVGYGFAATSNSAAPSLVIGDTDIVNYKNLTTLTSITESVLTEAKLCFDGWVSTDTELGSLTYTVTLTDTANSSLSAERTGKLTYTLREDTQYVYDWAFSLTSSIYTSAMQKVVSDGSGLYTVEVKISASNGEVSNQSRTYYLDTKAPSISNVTISIGYTSGDIIFINNNTPFTVSGTTTDNYLIEKTVFTFMGVDSDGKATTVSKENTNISWSGTSIDLSSFVAQSATDAVLAVTATDSAGNIKTAEYNIEFDTTVPVGAHEVDKKNKDLVFRIGDSSNDLSELTAYNNELTELDDTLDKDVGGKYASGTWGNAQTIMIRGDFIEEGSGLAMIYYKLFEKAPSEDDIATFFSDYASEKDGSFAPLSEKITRRVSYTNASGNKAFKEIDSSFKTTITGLATGNNYLVLVAVDNVGNAGVDMLTATYIADESAESNNTWNGDVACYSLNVDIESPTLSSTTSGAQYTNGVQNISVAGTMTDADSGASSVVLSVNGQTVDATLTVADSDGTGSWSAVIPASTILSELSSGTTYNVNATVTDKAGNASASTIFTLQVDTKAPTLAITTPSAGSIINGTVTMQGSVAYEGATPETLTLYYSTAVPNSSNVSDFKQIAKIGDPSKIYSWTISDIDTVLYAAVSETSPSLPLYIIPVVTDTAGNCTIYTESLDGTKTYSFTSGSNYFTYTVDQNTDRPIIQITSMDNADSWLGSATIRGTLNDDDGIASFAISEDGATYNPVTVSNGSWSYIIKSGDGEGITLYFKVVDSAGATFTTAADSLFARPYYLFSGTTASDYQSANTFTDYGFDNKTALSVNLDVQSPKISTAGMAIASSMDALADVSDVAADTSETYTISAKRYAGGDSKYLKLYVPAFDDNLSAVTISIADTTSNSTETQSYSYVSSGASKAITEDSYALTATSQKITVDSVEYTYYETAPILVSAASSGSKTFTISVSDKAGNTTPATYPFTVDNTGPDTITVTSPSSTDEITGTATITGTASDSGVGIESIEWLIPPKNYTSSVSDETLSGYEGWTSSNNTGTVSIWKFKFTAGSTTDLTAYDDDNVYAVAYDEDSQTYRIPLFFKTTDLLGNYYIDRSYYIMHNPDADRPVTEFSYPTDSDYDTDLSFVTLAGTIRTSGTVEVPSGTVDVGQVYVQIGTVAESGDITWSAANATLASEFATLGGVHTKATLDESYTATTDGTTTSAVKYVDDDWWGIPATTKTATWNLSLNTDGNLNPSSEDSTTNIAIRACAINADGKMGNWSEIYYIHVDSNAPSQSAEMRQYTSFVDATAETSSTIKVSKEYASEMYLKGTWYLVVTLSDNDSLASDTLSVKRGSANTAYSQTEKTWTYTDGTTSNGDTPFDGKNISSVTKTLYIPIKTEEMVSSTVSYTVYIADESGYSSTMTYSFYIDNTAPEIATLTGNDNDLLAESDVPLVANSNYVYTLGSKISEEGSGFDKLFFYFCREKVTDGSKPRLLDVMTDYAVYSDAAVYSSELDSYTLTQGANTYTMYGKSYEGSLNDKRTTFTSSENLESNIHIRTGGLMYIGGEYQVITSVSGASVTFDTAISDSIAVTEAGFPYGQVIDHTSTEKTTWNSSTLTYDITNDDGDGMPETVSKVGTTWTIDGTLYSDRMNDGPVTIVCIAFDKAGNVAGKSIETKVQNNAPRLAKLYLGTDLSGDGKYATSEFNTYTFVTTDSSTNKSSNFVETVDFETAGTTYANYGTPFKIRSGLAVVPELTGGNGTIKMKFLNNATSETGYQQKSGNSDSSFYAVDTNSVVTAEFSTIEASKSSAGVDDTTQVFVINDSNLTGLSDGTNKAMSFTFWDSTDGTICGTDSNHCFVRVSDFTVALNDSTAPKTVINPFYWTSAESNSLYGNSSSNGHIELEKDWLNSDGYNNALLPETERDADPKVSGKITMTGYAYDDQRLSSLWVSFDGFTPSTGYFTDVGDYNKSANGITASSGTYTVSDGKTYYQVAYYTPSDGTWVAATSVITSGTESTTGSVSAAISGGWEFSITDATSDENEAYLSQNGHKVLWTFSIDTEKITGIAAADSNARVIAFDHSYNVVGLSDSNITGTPYAVAQLTESVENNAPYYKMDIVPYIAGVKTSLSSLKKANSSIYDRTALGHYPTGSSETIFLYGFNLEEGTLYDSATTPASAALTEVTASAQTSWYSKSSTGTTENFFKTSTNTKAYSAGSISAFTSGKVYVKVKGVQSLNNLNDNEASGDYIGTSSSSTGDATVYANYYNRQPNGDSNNLLTDDVVVDVWAMNSKAAKPISGVIADPVMKINPSTGVIGFAFTNGPLYFSMPGTVASATTNRIAGGENSYAYWQGSYDFMSSIGFTYDSDGHTYGVAAGGDINSTQADRFGLMTDRWGISGEATGGSYEGSNALRLEAIAQYGDSSGNNTGTLNFDKNRVKSPSIATSRKNTSNATNIYMAYFDDLNEEIRFRYGSLLDSQTTKDSFNNFYDAYRNNTINNSSNLNNGKYSLSYCQVIADSAGTTTLGQAGEYVSIDVVQQNVTTGKDVVVLVWYDSHAGNLMYAYNDNPTAATVGKNKTNWPSIKTIFTGAGEYCQIVADANGGLHIAAYDGSNGDLKYAYLSKYDSDYDESSDSCTVDSYAIIGQNLTIDVALDSSGTAVPYIGYYGLSSTKPKIAYKVSETVTNGASDDVYTSGWEVSIVPTSSRVPQDRVNVAVWKNSTGVISGSTTGTSSAGTYYGTCYGNGTGNPVLGYQIRESSTSGYIETAQMQ